MSDAQMTSYMAELGNVNAPIVLGEIAHDETQGNNVVPINYELLMTLSAQHNFGYLIWWWGRIEEGSSSPLYITTNGMANSLTTDGNVFINTHANSIANNSIRPYKFVNGECDDMGIDENMNEETVSIYPNPFKNELNIDSKLNLKNIEIYNAAGQKILQSKEKSISTQSLKTGVYFVKIQTDKGVETIKIIKK